MIGRRRAFTIGCVIYGIGSLTTALAPNLAVLILGWSVLEGIGAALILPAIVALVAGNFPPEARPRAYGLVMGAGAIAVAVGPLIGGFATTYFSWRWVFVGEVVVVIGILALARRVKDTPLRRRAAGRTGSGRGRSRRDPGRARHQPAGAGRRAPISAGGARADRTGRVVRRPPGARPPTARGGRRSAERDRAPGRAERGTDRHRVTDPPNRSCPDDGQALVAIPPTVGPAEWRSSCLSRGGRDAELSASRSAWRPFVIRTWLPPPAPY